MRPKHYRYQARENWQTRLRRLLPHALLVLFWVLLINLVVRYLWVSPVRMLSKAMEPTIPQGSLFFVEDKKVDFVTPQQIVRVDHPLGGRIYCRVVAVEGQQVAIENGQLLLNNQLLPLTSVTSPSTTFPYSMSPRDQFPPTTIRPGFFFCLHDNRHYINDSRTFGPLELHYISGLVRFHRWLGSKI